MSQQKNRVFDTFARLLRFRISRGETMKFERSQKRGKLMKYRANGKLPAAGNPNFHSRKSVQMFTVGCGGAPANKKIRPGQACEASRPGLEEGNGDSRSHLEAEAHHGDEIVEQAAVLRAGRRRNDFFGECRDVVTEFGAQEDPLGEGKFDTAADTGHGLHGLRLGEVAELAERLIGRFRTRAAEDFHAAASGREELDLTVVPGGFEDQVVVDDMGYAGESGFAAAALQAQVALHVGVAEFAADVFVLADADVSA